MQTYLPWLIGFHVLVFAALVVDLWGVGMRRHEMPMRVAIGMTAVWIALGLAFGGAVTLFLDPAKGLEYFAAYVIEKALSVDNIFVFILVFTTFGVAQVHQRKVLLWGILGAILLRGSFIALGSVLLGRFHWLIYFFGLALLWAAWRASREHGVDAVDPAAHPVVRAASRWLPIRQGPHAGRFFRSEGGRWFATSLFLTLLAIEASDVMFAMDSIPAVFGISQDPFIIYTSNVFAILGLRSLYFVLAGAIVRLRFFQQGLAIVLAFVGGKMLLHQLIHVPTGLALAIVVGVLGVAAAASLLRPNRQPGREA